VLRRPNPKPKLESADRAVLAALARLLPRGLVAAADTPPEVIFLDLLAAPLITTRHCVARGDAPGCDVTSDPFRGRFEGAGMTGLDLCHHLAGQAVVGLHVGVEFLGGPLWLVRERDGEVGGRDDGAGVAPGLLGGLARNLPSGGVVVGGRAEGKPPSNCPPARRSKRGPWAPSHSGGPPSVWGDGSSSTSGSSPRHSRRQRSRFCSVALTCWSLITPRAASSAWVPGASAPGPTPRTRRPRAMRSRLAAV